MLKDHIAELSKALELQLSLATSTGGYSLDVDETSIAINDFVDGFQFFAQVAKLPKEQIEPFLALLLRGNLFGQATNRSILGLDETGTTIVLRYNYPLKTNYRDFKEKLEDFINVIDFWKKEVKNHPIKA